MAEETKMRAKAMVEILGSPKEHVEEAMKTVMEKAKGSFNVISYNIYEAQEIQGLWSTFADIDLNFKDIDQLVGFCFEYMPSSIEITEPLNIGMKCVDLSNMMNDLLAKIHRYDMAVKNLNAENVLLKRKIDGK